MSDTSGPTSATPLARWDRDSSSWRTSPDTSLWDLPMSSLTLPKWGMTLAGVLYELPTPALPTVAPASSSLPTRTAADGTKMSSNPETSARRRMNGNQASLTDIVQTDLLPTPTVMDMGANYTPQEWEAWKARQRAAHQNGNGHGASLTQEAISLLPTPKGGDGERGRDLPRLREDTASRGLAIAASTGAATPPPSTDGSGSSDDEHQPPLFPA